MKREIFTDKAKEFFEEWYFKNFIATKDIDINDILDDQFYFDCFYKYPLAFQWGVIQDFSDSLKYEVSDRRPNYLIEYKNGKDSMLYSGKAIFSTRQEARTAAIEKLNKLINEK